MTGSTAPGAECQLNEINDWITRSASADVAKRFLIAVRAHIESLSTFPLAGRSHGAIRVGLRNTTFKKRTVVAYLVTEEKGQRVITILIPLLRQPNPAMPAPTDETCAAGVPSPWKSAPCPGAWIRLREGATLDAEALREWCAGKLAHYKVPKYVRITDEFPMTVTGKVQKFKMRDTSIEELNLHDAAAIVTA
jgi:acyl-CoA synthetase (AMP-forming)/AMP-acid ligase II